MKAPANQTQGGTASSTVSCLFSLLGTRLAPECLITHTVPHRNFTCQASTCPTRGCFISCLVARTPASLRLAQGAHILQKAVQHMRSACQMSRLIKSGTSAPVRQRVLLPCAQAYQSCVQIWQGCMWGRLGHVMTRPVYAGLSATARGSPAVLALLKQPQWESCSR